MICKSKRKYVVIPMLLLISVFFRVYRIQDISLDYDEHKTIYAELKNTTIQTFTNYLTLRNAYDYQMINDTGTKVGWELNICFPLYYLPMKLAALFNDDIVFLRFCTALFGILTPIIIFLVGRRYSWKIGVMGALLLLFHPWAQNHSVHIRFYEFWALLSAISLWYVEFFLNRLQYKQTRIWHMVVLSIMLLLPCTVHAFGVLTTIFLVAIIAAYIASCPRHIKINDIPAIQRLAFYVTTFILTIIVSVNLLVFAYASVVENHPAYLHNSESAIHIFISSIFNFAYFYIAVAGMCLLATVLNWKSIPFPLKRYSVAYLVSISLCLVVLVKPQSFRPDFFYGTLPFLCLLLAFQIDHFSKKWFSPSFSIQGSLLLVCLLILSNLPTFVSNVFIDFDRLPFLEAARMANKFNTENAALYATNHNYINAYLSDNIVQPMTRVNPEHCQSSQDEYFFISMRKGRSMQFFYDYSSLKNVQLIQILGESRLDLRANHIFLFYRKNDKAAQGRPLSGYPLSQVHKLLDSSQIPFLLQGKSRLSRQ